MQEGRVYYQLLCWVLLVEVGAVSALTLVTSKEKNSVRIFIAFQIHSPLQPMPNPSNLLTIFNIFMPTLALNTAGLNAEAAERAVRYALAAGITHVNSYVSKPRPLLCLAQRS